MKKNIKDKIWTEKYRPHDIKDVVLPSKVKSKFIKMIDQKEIQHLLLVGSAGTGKTTCARVFCEMMKADYIFINASDERGIDVLREKVKQFCSRISTNPNVSKIVILDEADNMSSASLMALRGFIEQFQNTSRFVITANYENKLPEPIRSRTLNINFNSNENEKKQMMMEFYKRLFYILENEGKKIDNNGKKILAEFVKEEWPDMRLLINKLQYYLKDNEQIDENFISIFFDEKEYEEFFKLLKEKQFTKVRKWINENIGESGLMNFYRVIEKKLEEKFVVQSIPEAILILQRHQYEASFSFIKEINMMSCSIQLMANCQFK